MAADWTALRTVPLQSHDCYTVMAPKNGRAGRRCSVQSLQALALLKTDWYAKNGDPGYVTILVIAIDQSFAFRVRVLASSVVVQQLFAWGKG
jgi:hypothetical protein